MRRLLLAAALAAATHSVAPTHAAAGASAASNPQTAVEELLAADRAFSDAGAGSDLVTALSAMLDEHVVMPLPGAGFARSRSEVVAALRDNPLNEGARARWSPVRGGVSADGEHGFTFGYMLIDAEGKPARHAKYLSYWVKRPQGWRVAAYKRVPRGEGEPTASLPPLVPARSHRGAKSKIETLRRSLDAAERAFSDEAQIIGLSPAFRRYGRADAMNMGRGAAFVIGADAIASSIGEEGPSPVRWAPDGVLVAASGDLGITWGMIRTNGPPPEGQPAAVPYSTVWYRESADEPWRYVAE